MFKRNLLLSVLVVSFASGCTQEPASEEGQIDVIDIPLSEPVATSVEAPVEVVTTPEDQTAPSIEPELK